MQDSRHPSLHFKRVGQFWSVRVGLHYRALAIEEDSVPVWVWIGTHAEYDTLVRSRAKEAKMATVVLDEHTAEELHAAAAASGMTVDAYVKSLLAGGATLAAPRLSWSEVESILDQHAFDGPMLPSDFSRADIYAEHD